MSEPSTDVRCAAIWRHTTATWDGTTRAAGPWAEPHDGSARQEASRCAADTCSIDAFSNCSDTSCSHPGKGNRWVRGALIQAAHAAATVKGSSLAAEYRRLVVRREAKKAIVTIARKLLVLAYTLLRKCEPYQERGEMYLDERRKEQTITRMRRRIEQLGYTVHLEPPHLATAT